LTEDEAMLSGFIIINLDGMQLGVIIDKVLRVVSVNMGQIQPPPQMITGIGSEYIQGVIHQDDGYLIILDIRRLFDPEELQNISNVNP
jgi:purine-binding chemotaxis protein CheW